MEEVERVGKEGERVRREGGREETEGEGKEGGGEGGEGRCGKGRHISNRPFQWCMPFEPLTEDLPNPNNSTPRCA